MVIFLKIETQSKEMEKVKQVLQKAERDLISKDTLLQQQEQKISLLQSNGNFFNLKKKKILINFKLKNKRIQFILWNPKHLN